VSVTSVSVRSAGGAYRVQVERGALDRLGRRLRDAGLERRAVVVTDAHVGALYADRARRALRRAGMDAEWITIPAGERSKTLATAHRVYTQLAECGADRETPIVALGGGVVGDLAGFVAATWLRGVPLVHVPTTLLAQADSSIGGKTAVDLAAGKNLVGAFHAPRLVVTDPDLLATLPPRHFANGLAEIAKVGMALDRALFRNLEGNADDVLALRPRALDGVLTAAIRAKARVVGTDERDRGRRLLLNYGHTTGHALEALGGYRRWLHGEAVALGMRVAARIARHRGVLGADAEARQNALLARLGFARRFPEVTVERLAPFLARDKKARAGAWAFVLTTGIGVATVQRLTGSRELERALRELSRERGGTPRQRGAAA
jgi:3-dehydroquinate synthase